MPFPPSLTLPHKGGESNGVDLEGWARAGRTYEGRFLLAQMERLKSHLHDAGSALQDEFVSGVLQFGVDDKGTGFIKGRIDGTLLLTCQRCLKGVEHAVAHDFRLCLVRDESACVQVEETSDPLILKEFSGYLDDLIEDELLLTLPIVMFHQQSECLLEEGAKRALAPATENKEKAERKNPFSVLKQHVNNPI